MRRQMSKLVLILCALFAIFVLTLSNAQPTTAGKGTLRADKLDAALLAAIRANPKGKFPVIVQTVLRTGRKFARNANANRARGAADLINRLAGKSATNVNRLVMIGGATAKLPVKKINKLSREPSVSLILLDRELVPLGTPATELQSIAARVVRAPEVWAQGYKGQGIGVAILDSGVAAHTDLMQPGSRVVASVDFVNGTAPAFAAPLGDPGGHGTHVAGIVAGNGTQSDGKWKGIAPSANIVNVRVIGSNGVTNLSTVIRGIQWVVQNRQTYNIRVMNLSLGAATLGTYRNDPLAGAVEMAWNSGIVVVASAGNAGPLHGTISTPGIDPYIVTVGALDDGETLSLLDDFLAPFSSHGPTPDGLNKPDLVAPGRRIVSLRVPNSYLDTLLPDRVTDTNYFRLSGTSMSAPVVAGTTALMLQKRPALQPNQVKKVLMQTARPVGLVPDLNGSGAGLVDAYAATNSTLTSKANAGLTPADDFCKSVYALLRGMPLNGIWRDPYRGGFNWGNVTWDNITWDRTTWENIAWDNITWDNITWTNVTWDNITWDAGEWDSTLTDNSNGTWDALGELE